jgi:hypothetical protein
MNVQIPANGSKAWEVGAATPGFFLVAIRHSDQEKSGRTPDTPPRSSGTATRNRPVIVSASDYSAARSEHVSASRVLANVLSQDI